MMRRPRRPMSTLLLGLSPRTDDDERQQMHALAGQGWSLRQIGRHLGRDHHAVRRCLARPTDYRIKYPDRPRDHRGCFVRREEYLQQLTLLTEAEQELRAVRDRVETAQRGQHPSPEEWMELQQRVRRLQALKTQLASGSVLSSRAPSPPAPRRSETWHRAPARSAGRSPAAHSAGPLSKRVAPRRDQFDVRI